MDNTIIRGTTPTLRITTSANLSGMTVYLAIAQRNIVVIEKSGDDLDISHGEEGSVITVKLTQEETLDLSNDSPAKVQFRAVSEGGRTAIASEIATFSVGIVLKEGVLE